MALIRLSAKGRARADHSTPSMGSGLRSLFAPQALEFGPTHMLVGDQWVRAYIVTALPPSVDAGWLADAANLPGVTLSLHALPEDTAHLVMDLSRKIAQLQGQLETRSSAITAQRTVQQLADAQELMRQLDAEQQAAFTVAIVLLVTAPDAATGRRLAKRLEGQLGAKGIRPRTLSFRQEAGLQAAGPWGLLPDVLQGTAPYVLPVSTVAASWPFSSGGINHGKGIVLGRDSDDGLVLVERWDLDAIQDSGVINRNWVILAGSGAGKSHTTKLMVLREWAQGAVVVIMDPEREYKGLCDRLGGTWLNAGGGVEKINFLQAPPLPADVDADEDESGLSALALHALRAKMVLELYLAGGLTPIQRALLSRLLRDVYTQAGIGFDVDPATIPADQWPNIRHLYDLARQRADDPGEGPDYRTLAGLLEDAAVGFESQLWAGPSAPPPAADFIVIDLHDLENAPDYVQRAQYANVLGYAWDIVRRNRAERVIFVVDEAWMLADPRVPEALGYLRKLAKRIRKYAGSLTIVSQNAIDFLGDAVKREGEPVLSNASVKLLLRQEAKDLPAVTELYGLSDAEQELLANAKRGTGLIIAGNSRAWVKIDTAPYEAALLEGATAAAE